MGIPKTSRNYLWKSNKVLLTKTKLSDRAAHNLIMMLSGCNSSLKERTGKGNKQGVIYIFWVIALQRCYLVEEGFPRQLHTAVSVIISLCCFKLS